LSVIDSLVKTHCPLFQIPLPFGVRTVSTPSGTHGISRLEEFEDGKAYVCSDKKTVKPLNLNAARNVRPPWFIRYVMTYTEAFRYMQNPVQVAVKLLAVCLSKFQLKSEVTLPSND